MMASGLASSQFCRAQTPAPAFTPGAGELALEGQVQTVDEPNGQVTLLATAFSTPGGRGAIAPPKTKVLLISEQTIFWDERIGRATKLAELMAGTPLRALGRDAGSGQSLAARLLIWRSPEPIESPTEAPKPLSVAELLPPSQEIGGVRVSLLDAGFESEKRLFQWGKNTDPTFFLAFRVETPVAVDAENPWWKWARFTGLSAPQGQTLWSSSAGAWGEGEAQRALTFARVDPRWPSVTAHWEIAPPGAPASANGQFSGYYEINGPAPSPQQPRVEPGKAIQTAHGTIYILDSIECDYARHTTTFSLAVEKPAEVPDAHVSTYPTRIRDDQGTLFRGFTKAETDRITISCDALPAQGATALTLGLQVQESAESWKQAQFFPTIDLEIPVAALLEARPPRLKRDALPNYQAHNADIAARLEEAHRSELRWWGTVWLRPTTADAPPPTETTTQIVALGGRATTGDGREFEVTIADTQTPIFHGDNSAPAPGETAFALQIEITGEVPADPVTLRLETARTRSLLHVVDLPALAVPAAGASLIPKSPARGAISLQKIAWIETQSADATAITRRTGATIGPNGALALIFATKRALTASTLSVEKLQIRAPSGALPHQPSATYNGDVLTGAGQNTLWSLIVPAPPYGVVPLKLHLELLENGGDEPGERLDIAGVMLKPGE